MPSGSRSTRLHAIAAGLLAAGVGLTVQAGWLLERAVLVQLHPSYPAMTFNTGFGFVLCGAGLLAMALGRRTGMTVFAWTVVVLGGLTLLEYLAGVNLGIDELIVRDPYQVKTLFPGRMAVTTAFAFVASGAVLLALARRREDGAVSWAWPSAAVYWVLLSATIGILRYAGGIGRLFAWPLLDSMALHSAVSFLLVGSSLVAELRQRERLWLPWGPDQHGRRIVLIASALLTVAILIFGSFSLGSVAAEAWRFTREQLTATAQARAAAIAVEVSRILDLIRVAVRDERLLGPMARRADGAALSRADADNAEAALGGMVAANDHILAVALLDDAGDVVLSSDPGASWPALTPEDRAGVGAEPILGVPRWEAGELHAEVVAALLGTGRRLGFLVLRLALADVAAIVTSVSGIGDSGEVMLGRRAGDRLEFLLPPRLGRPLPQPVSWAAERALPMRRALRGESGVSEALDYQGVWVAAAFLPVRGTEWGLVVKTDVAELLAPFRRAAKVMLAGTPVAVALGTALFWLLVGPVVRRLADRERFVRTIVESVPVGLFTAEGPEVTYVNPYLCRLTGLSHEDLLGRAWQQTATSEDRQRFVDATTRTLTEAKRFSREFRVVGPSGRHRWVHVAGVPLRAPADQDNNMLGFCFDITRRKQAERALDREHKTAAAISVATLHFLETGDLEGMVRLILERCTQLTGASSGCIAMTRPDGELDLIGASDLVWQETTPNALAAAARQEFEQRGSCEISAPASSPLRAAAPPGGIASDEAESGSRSRGTPEGQREPEPLVGVPLRTGKEIVGFIGLAGRPGGFRDEDRAEIERLAPMAALAITSAQSQQARQLLFEQLARAQKMEVVGRLAGGVAHDFNNLLTVISTNTDLLGEDASISPRQRRYLESIGQAGERAAILTRQLLAFARRQVLEPRVLDINAIVTDLVEMLQRLIGEDIELQLSLAPELPHVRVDLGRIEQVIANLAVNARDAMPAGGELTLTTAIEEIGDDDARKEPGVAPGRYVVLEVSDSGTGLTEEVKAHLFEPFFTTKGEQGTGLGLATASGIIEQHRGGIRVDSGEGRGTVFKIYLPAVAAEIESPTARLSSDAMPHGSETLLFVEDDDRVRTAACAALSRLGYRVLAAARPQQALEVAAAHRGSIALLITDVVMPQMSGADLARRIREMLPRSRILFTSGYPDDFIGRRHVLESDAAFLQKPYGLARLAQKVRQELDRPAPASGTRS